MGDRLVWLLERFELAARVIQAGPLCDLARYEAVRGLGHIHALRRGAICVTTDGSAPRVVEEPSLIFYMNPTGHSIVPQGELRPDMVCASFEFGAGLRNPLARALPDVLVVKLHTVPAVGDSLGILFSEAAANHCGRQAVLNRLVEVVIIQLLRELMDQELLKVGLLAGLADPKLAKAINVMHADPSRAWSLEELAETAGMSRARFAARFRDTVGLTPGAYLGEWRIGVAQSLLRRGKPVQFIADAVGYGSASALSRAFTAQVGVSPTQWLGQDMHGMDWSGE